jgi:hypothetical protein
MTTPTPQNSNETAYVALALISDLIDLLADKGCISDVEIDGVYKSSAARLSQENNFDASSASKFLTDWIKRKPQVE